MFRTMRRFKQELTREECLAVLRSQPRGVLSLLGENGYPYGLPIDYWYNETDGKLYFHGAKEGHKIDAIRACDKASFCVHDEGQRVAGEWPLHFCSVIVFGRIAPVTDAALPPGRKVHRRCRLYRRRDRRGQGPGALPGPDA